MTCEFNAWLKSTCIQCSRALHFEVHNAKALFMPVLILEGYSIAVSEEAKVVGIAG